MQQVNGDGEEKHLMEELSEHHPKDTRTVLILLIMLEGMVISAANVLEAH
jgi:hypothetical protein